MDPLWKLALRILALTVVLLAAVGGWLVLSLARDAPPPVSPEIFPQLGHSLSIRSVAWSPDGSTLASASDDTSLKLWDVSSGNLLRTLSGHSGPISSVAWSPDGKTLASASDDTSLKLWDVSSGTLLRTLSDHSRAVSSVAWSPDGKTLASGGDDGIRLWDASTGNPLNPLRSGPVLSIAWKSGDTLVLGHADNTLEFWNASSGKRTRTFHLSGPVRTVAWSPNGTTLAVGSAGNSLELWDSLADARAAHKRAGSMFAGLQEIFGNSFSDGLLFTLSGHFSPVRAVAWSPDGKTLASGSDDGTLKLWDASSGRLLDTLSSRSDIVRAVAWSPDGKTLASGSDDTTLDLWDASSGNRIRTLSGHSASVRAVAWSPDGKTLASGSDDGTLKLWDALAGDLLRTLAGPSSRVMSVAWSPDGKTLASGHDNKTLKLWDAASGEVLRTLPHHTGRVWSVAWSPDGRTLASGHDGKTLKLWDTASGKLRTLPGHSGSISSVAWSPDGKTLASGSYDNSLMLWDATSGKPLRTLFGHSNAVFSIAWSPDGKTLASGSYDNSLKLWDASSGALLQSFSGGHSSFVLSVAWSPDGRALASGGGDGSVALWQSTGELEWFSLSLPRDVWLTYHPTKLLYVASPSGDQLAAVRFASRTYPLTYYRENLWRTALSRGSSQDLPAIKPKPLRHAWEHWRGGPWLALALVLYATEFTVVLRIAHQRPLRQVYRFFSSVGATRIHPIADNLLSFSPTSGGPRAYALLLHGQTAQLLRNLSRVTSATAETVSVYIIYTDPVPEDVLTYSREHPFCHVIPILQGRMATALSQGTSSTLLQEAELRVSGQFDPYDDAKSVEDSSSFHGRASLLDRFVAALNQGQHIGLCGLRKIGKTSLLNKLRTRAPNVPVVYINCRTAGILTEAGYFHAIIEALHREFQRLQIPYSPMYKQDWSPEAFCEEVLRFSATWGRTGPFLLLLDEIDQLFLDQHQESGAQLRAEYLSLFQSLQTLAQEHQCLAVVAASHWIRSNWQTAPNSSSRQNPLYLQEYLLGPLDITETRSMVEKIGVWSGIHWEPEALNEIHALCGGHPFLTRLIASDACDKGRSRHVTFSEVQAAACAIQSHFPSHKIGEYYQTIWNESRDDERRVLQVISGEASGFQESLFPKQFKEALTRVERSGLVHRKDGRLLITAQLLQQWILRSKTPTEAMKASKS